jgi:hypothetical protein
MKSLFPGIPEQITRLAVVFAVLVIGVTFVRQFVIPPQLKETGFHREMAVEQEVNQEVKYAGSSICVDCHDEINEIKKEGHHRNLSCETCHGPALTHTEDPVENLPIVPRDRRDCTICHTYNPSRPTGFPQINPIAHNPLKPCMLCHNPHQPEPPEMPWGCSACHAEIARTLAVSHHALIECTMCHIAPEDHRSSPRIAKPTKPVDRTFCGQCHGLDSKNAESPKIELTTHFEKYVCWQCHYPHMPEGG